VNPNTGIVYHILKAGEEVFFFSFKYAKMGDTWKEEKNESGRNKQKSFFRGGTEEAENHHPVAALYSGSGHCLYGIRYLLEIHIPLSGFFRDVAAFCFSWTGLSGKLCHPLAADHQALWSFHSLCQPGNRDFLVHAVVDINFQGRNAVGEEHHLCSGRLLGRAAGESGCRLTGGFFLSLYPQPSLLLHRSSWRKVQWRSIRILSANISMSRSSSDTDWCSSACSWIFMPIPKM